MSTYTQLLYHIVFSTKNRERVLIKENREKLYRYIWGILKHHKSVLYRINGVEDHVHIITHIHPTVAVASLIKDIKVASSDWIKNERIFPMFSAWQVGYGAFTYSIKEKDVLINYVKNQEEHHKKVSFKDEYISLLKEHGIEFDEKYLF